MADPSVPRVDVRYGKGWSVTLIVLASLLVAMAAFLGNPLTLALGVFNLVIGILMLTRPLYVLGPASLEVKNLLGMTLKRYAYRNISEFEITPDGTLWHCDVQGVRKKIRISRLVVDSGDYRRLLDTLSTRAFD
jgi:hypothetical protein